MIHTFEALFSGIIRKRVTFAHSRWVEELDIKVTKFLILMVNIPYPLFWAWLASLMKFVVITLYNGIYRAKVKNDPHFFSSEKEKNKPCRKCHSREKNRKLWRGLTSSIELNRVEPSADRHSSSKEESQMQGAEWRLSSRGDPSMRIGPGREHTI